MELCGFNGKKSFIVRCCWEIMTSEDAVMEISAIVDHVFFKTKWLCGTSKDFYGNLGKKYFRGRVMLLHLCCTTELSPKSSNKGQSWRVTLSWHNGQSHHTLCFFPFCSVFSTHVSHRSDFKCLSVSHIVLLMDTFANSVSTLMSLCTDPLWWLPFLLVIYLTIL